MKQFNYFFQGNITVILNDENRLVESIQEGTDFIIHLINNSIIVNLRGETLTYPNTIAGFKAAYEACGFEVSYYNDSVTERIIIKDGDYIKEMLYDSLNANYIVAMLHNGRRVLLSTGLDGWSCTSTVDNSIDIKRGSSEELDLCPLLYANQLQTVFNLPVF